MKRYISLLLVLLLVLAAPALAENPTGGSTNLTYTVAQSYTMSIPASVQFGNETDTVKYSIGVNAKSLIDVNKQLTVSIYSSSNYDTEHSKFRMINSSDNSIYLDYTIKKPNAEAEPVSVVLNTPFLTANAAECYSGKNVELTFEYTTGTAQRAGAHTDTLTFTIAVDNIPPEEPES